MIRVGEREYRERDVMVKGFDGYPFASVTKMSLLLLEDHYPWHKTPKHSPNETNCVLLDCNKYHPCWNVDTRIYYFWRDGWQGDLLQFCFDRFYLTRKFCLKEGPIHTIRTANGPYRSNLLLEYVKVYRNLKKLYYGDKYIMLILLEVNGYPKLRPILLFCLKTGLELEEFIQFII